MSAYQNQTALNQGINLYELGLWIVPDSAEFTNIVLHKGKMIDAGDLKA